MQAKWRDGRPMKKVAGRFIKPNDRLTSFERLEIYNRQYWFRLKDCFYDDYPGLRAILGDRRFERLARRLPGAASLANPSPCAIWAGGWWNFWRPNRAGSRRLQRLALDMARLEWAHIEAFDNEAQPPLEMDSLLGVDPARIRLQLQPHLTLLQLGYEVDEFLIQIKQAKRLRNEASNAMEMRRARLRKPAQAAVAAQDRFPGGASPQRHGLLQAAGTRPVSPVVRLPGEGHAGRGLRGTGGVGRQADLGAQVKSWFETWAALGWFCQLE